MEQRIGQQVGTCRVLRFLAQGSEAQVYLGESITSKSMVAIKIFHERYLIEEKQKKMLAELRVFARLNHPHIVHIFDFGIEEQFHRTHSLYICLQHCKHWPHVSNRLGQLSRLAANC